MANTEGTWLTINDYSQFKNISISTIRRHIKANLVKWKNSEGKYHIWTASKPEDIEIRKEGEVLTLRLEIQRLEMENRRLKEELSEMRMLVSIYENQSQETNEMRQ